jgi:hypothetical protein
MRAAAAIGGLTGGLEKNRKRPTIAVDVLLSLSRLSRTGRKTALDQSTI